MRDPGPTVSDAYFARCAEHLSGLFIDNTVIKTAVARGAARTDGRGDGQELTGMFHNKPPLVVALHPAV